eukprot:snap_masked-scaffold_12-processed-gene-11.52-mRNA-1 protein AED:1.00 eAED:1.00 QI:0/-1/0/0/-1/1/1/0/73
MPGAVAKAQRELTKALSDKGFTSIYKKLAVAKKKCLPVIWRVQTYFATLQQSSNLVLLVSSSHVAPYHLSKRL